MMGWGHECHNWFSRSGGWKNIFVRGPNWETADEKKVPNWAGEVQSAKCRVQSAECKCEGEGEGEGKESWELGERMNWLNGFV